MNIKNSLRKLIRRFSQPKSAEITLCGKTLHVYPGSVRNKTDQDDAWWFALTEHHSKIYDIGCNVGYTALLALIQDGTKQMLLVDPNPDALVIASNNIIKNGIGSQVNYLSAFVSDTMNEQVQFYTVDYGAAGSMYTSHAKTAAALNLFTYVETVTLDHLYGFYDFAPSLVKIDVEGAEMQVMKGSKKLAKDTGCLFFVEMHKLEHLEMAQNVQFMLDWCDEMNYVAWYLKDAKILQSVDPVKHRGKFHLLLMPKGIDYPNYLKGIQQYSPLP